MKISHKIRRKVIQICAFGFSNMHVENFFPKAKLYTGKWKSFCNPGLNCASCPAAHLACPLGALQNLNGSSRIPFSLYITGFLLAVGTLLGRWVCGFLCPFGLVQELIGKIPVKKHRLPKWTRAVKYVLLVWFVLLWPLIQKMQDVMGVGNPAFCEYICPAGLLTAGVPFLATHSELQRTVGPVFSLKLIILVLTVVGCLFVFRFFCKVMCPLGAVYGLLNRISLYRLSVNEDACVHCGKCAAVCRMDVDPVRAPNSTECIRCGDCAHACPKGAIHIGFRAGCTARSIKNEGKMES